MNKEDYIEITHNDDRWLFLENLPNEEWRHIQGYEGLGYEVIKLLL